MGNYKLKWSFGNAKVSKLDAVSFGIPAYRAADGFATCPQAGACAAICYARQGRYIMPNVKASREFNLSRARGPLEAFAADAIEDLQRISETIVRIHDSGDFFSQEYVDAWARIARAFPNKRFYSYTKSLHLDFTSMPGNVSIVQSMGGKMDASIDMNRPRSRIFATVGDRERAGYVDGNINDGPAINGEQRIGLVYHGSRHLTEAQKGYFA